SNASDDEMEWEDMVPDNGPGDVVIEFPDADSIPGPSSGTGGGAAKGKGTGRKLDEAEKARINAERQTRLACHKVHTVALLVNAQIRNRWLNDQLLHARLMSLTPLSLQNHFDMITKRNQPDKGLRGRQFEAAMHRLTDWWYHNFDVEDGPNMHIRSRTFAEVQQELRAKGALPDPNAKPDPKEKGKAKRIPQDESEDDDDKGEIIRSSKSLMKHALMMRGSRDTSAQLFCALCRALGIPTRLVVSLQAVPWKTTVGKPPAPSKKKKEADSKGKAKEVPPTEEPEPSDDDDDMEEIVAPPSLPDPTPHLASPPKGKIKGKGKFPGQGATLNGNPRPKSPPAIHLRKSKSSWGAGRRLGESRSANNPPQGGWPPVFWCEVFSRPDGRWISVDPLRNLVNRKKLFEPPPNDRNNRMLYVIGFEE
ncbi:hypothetical protein FRB90_010924, partial [Tulasnella sp. 427]